MRHRLRGQQAFRAGELGAGQGQLGLGLRQLGLGRSERGLGRAGIKREQQLALALKYQRDARSGGAAPIRIRLQDETSYDRVGTLDFTDNAIDPASGTIRLRAVVPNADGFLKPGMFGQAQLAGAGAYQALLVPDAAIATDAARRVVIVVKPDGSTEPRAVQTGPLVDGLRVVRSGLKPTDRVIIAGGQRIQMPGMKVTPKNGTIAPVAQQPNAAAVTQAAPASSASFANAG